MLVQKSKIGIIGLGMVGDTLRKWFLEIKHYQQGKDLFCFDIDPKKIHQ
jgi:UDP-N-acetyl-D-mannosaminuronate dehydrogenase